MIVRLDNFLVRYDKFCLHGHGVRLQEQNLPLPAL